MKIKKLAWKDLIAYGYDRTFEIDRKNGFFIVFTDGDLRVTNFPTIEEAKDWCEHQNKLWLQETIKRWIEGENE